MNGKYRINAFADEASDLLEGQTAALLRNRLDGIEIRNIGAKSISDHTAAEAKELKKQLDSAGIKARTVGSPIGKINIETDSFEEHTEKFRRTLEIASILGSEMIRLFSFFIPHGKNPGDYRNEVIDRLGKFLDIAKGSGILLCHENEKGIYGDSAERCLDLYTALPGLHAIFDPANFIQCGQDTEKAWELLKSRILYLHIKDALADGSIVPAGKGIGNVEKIVSKYVAAGGREFTIEPHLTVFSGLSGLEREGNTSVVGTIYRYPSRDAAFDAACGAFLKILEKIR